MLEFVRTLWERTAPAGRMALVGGVVVIIAVTLGAFWWLSRPDYQVLFSDLDGKDAAAVIATLEKQKTPYQIAEDGRAILVEKSSLYRTRMKLMGDGLDLKGTVGLELFNTAEFGMTEFAQRINYQRALQGELARTIMGFDEVGNARVHLVLPETGLLRKRAARAKASVWITLRGKRPLSEEQVTGIQRLVAASIPEMEPGAVTVLDQKGVALSARERNEDSQSSVADANLQLKKDTELYLTRKVTDILDAAIGANQAAVGVDVQLDPSSVRMTREAVLGNPGPTPSAEGVLVRKRERLIGAEGAPGAPASTMPVTPGAPAPSLSKTIDAEYQTGREVQQSQTAPGAIRRLSVGVVTNTPLPDETVQQLRDVIGMAVGLDTNRGDGIAFTSLRDAGHKAAPAAPIASTSTPFPSAYFSGGWLSGALWLGGAIGLIGIVLMAVRFARSRQVEAKPQTLSAAERAHLLQQVRGWLAEENDSIGEAR